MNETRDPRPEFVANLEWQVRSAARRRSRFSEPTEPRGGRKMSMVVLILVSALMGAGGVVVKDQVQESRAREVLMARAAGEMRVAEAEMEIARSRLGEAERQYSNGIVGEEALLVARTRLLEVEMRLQALRLDYEEIEASGQEPRNGLAAPLVDGEDFVTRRLHLQMNLANEEVGLAQFRVDRVEERVQMGVVGEEELAQARLAVQQAESHLQDLGHRISLRSDYLAGEVTREEVERQAEVFSTQAQIELTRGMLDDAMTRFQRLEERVNLGVIPSTELDQARLQLMQIENQLEVLEVTLVTLQGG